MNDCPISMNDCPIKLERRDKSPSLQRTYYCKDGANLRNLDL
jgi:hypothetical protein